jgi:hypothetical protein
MVPVVRGYLPGDRPWGPAGRPVVRYRRYLPWVTSVAQERPGISLGGPCGPVSPVSSQDHPWALRPLDALQGLPWGPCAPGSLRYRH